MRGLIVVAFVLFLMWLRIVQPKKVKVVLRLGKSVRILREWLNWIIPLIEWTKTQSLAMMNLNVRVDWITCDNVKTTVELNVIFRVKDDNKSIIDSIFAINDPITAIKSMVEEQLRAKIFEFTHEEIFGKRTEIWDEVKNTLASKLWDFGMELDSVQVKDIALDAKVTEAMNWVVAADKNKQSTIKQAEWNKQSDILRAEADKQVKQLIGQWMALQREAIANWFKNSIAEIKDSDKNLHWQQILEFLLASSRIETLEKIWLNNSKIIYINENLEWKISSMVWAGQDLMKDAKK